MENREIKAKERMEQGRSKKLSDLIKLGMRKKMRSPAAWAANVFCAREKRKATADDFHKANSMYYKIKSGEQYE
jgi:hypothetical protein